MDKTELSQDEYIRLRKTCYALYGPTIADNIACAVVEAMGEDSTLEEYSLAMCIVHHLHHAANGDGPKTCYENILASKV